MFRGLCQSVLQITLLDNMPPVTRNGARRGIRGRGGRGGNAITQPQEPQEPQILAEQEPIVEVPAMEVPPLEQAMVVPPPAVQVNASQGVDQV